MSLISDLQLLKDKLIVIPHDLGMPQYRELVIRKKINNYQLQDVFFSPVPKVVNVNDRQISELISKETVQVNLEDYYVKHISRVKYDRYFLTQNVDMFILDYSNNAGNITGIRCRLLFLDEARTTSYEMYLKRLSDHESIEAVN